MLAEMLCIEHLGRRWMVRCTGELRDALGKQKWVHIGYTAVGPDAAVHSFERAGPCGCGLEPCPAKQALKYGKKV